MKLLRFEKATKVVKIDDAEFVIRPASRSLLIKLRTQFTNGDKVDELAFEKALLRSVIVEAKNVDFEDDLIDCIVDYQNLSSFIISKAIEFNEELSNKFDEELKN